MRFSAVVDGAWQTRAALSTLLVPRTPRHLLRDVVHLVGDAARGEVERERGPGSLRADRDPATRSSASSQRHPVKPRSPRRRTIGYGRRPSSRSSAPVSFRSGATSASTAGSSARHRVDAQQVEPRRAEVDARDRPVVEAGDAERAAVAHALAAGCATRTGGCSRFCPDDLRHVGVVVRLLLAHAVRLEPDPQVRLRVPFGALIRAEPFHAMRGPQPPSRSMRSGCVYTLPRPSRTKPTSVCPNRSAVATARLDGADTAHDDRDPGDRGLLHDLEAQPARHHQHRVARAAADRPITAWPTSLSTALWRPTSSRSTRSSPSGVNEARGVQPAGRVEDASARRGGVSGRPSSDGRERRRDPAPPASQPTLDLRRASPCRRSRSSSWPRRPAGGRSRSTGRRVATVTTLYSCSAPARRPGSSATSARSSVPVRRPSVRQKPTASSKSWPGVRIVTASGLGRLRPARGPGSPSAPR